MTQMSVSVPFVELKESQCDFHHWHSTLSLQQEGHQLEHIGSLFFFIMVLLQMFTISVRTMMSLLYFCFFVIIIIFVYCVINFNKQKTIINWPLVGVRLKVCHSKL